MGTAVAPELGLRMTSPVAKTKMKNPIIGNGYEDNAKSKAYFDTYITLEISSIFTKDKVGNAKSAKWTILASNDDSSEMPKQPSRRSYNSLLRYKSKVGNPLKSLTKGLYRIGFTTYKTGEVNGTFLAQIGLQLNYLVVVMSNTIEGLEKQIK